ncbi:MAG: DMT family transporter [Anaerolineae bacterium]
MQYLGEFAALGTSVSWTATATFFALAGGRVGSVVVNRVRLVFGAAFLVTAHWVLTGAPVPFGAEPFRWAWLGASGVVGLVIGDAFLFQAFVWIGARLSMLMMSLVPVFGAVLAWLFLGEELTGGQAAGVVLTISGVGWVVLAGRSGSKREDRPQLLLGVAFGLGAALAQALGLIGAKEGLAGDFSPLSGTLIRVLAGMGVLWAITILQRQAAPTVRRVLIERRALWHIVGGSFFGPFVGVTLSLAAVQATEVGVASTLMSLPPVFLLPVGYVVFGERFGWQALAGTALALVGVAVLFLV